MHLATGDPERATGLMGSEAVFSALGAGLLWGQGQGLGLLWGWGQSTGQSLATSNG